MAELYTLTKEYNCYGNVKKYKVIGVSRSQTALLKTARRLAEECSTSGDPWFDQLSNPDFDIFDWKTNKHLTVWKRGNAYYVKSKYYTIENCAICYNVSGLKTCNWIFEEV